jgi:hypothetical protein
VLLPKYGEFDGVSARYFGRNKECRQTVSEKSAAGFLRRFQLLRCGPGE